MTVGRTGALADHDRIAGAIFVGPFTCMPAAVVEAQQGTLSEETGIPIISIYYDGRDNSNREEFIQSLVFQASKTWRQSNT
jgi:predicted nucleotide-binding protein (sugar kinase/HSP70/actin superfamily)